MSAYKQEKPSEVGWYWQYWTIYNGPHHLRIVKEHGELWVINYAQPKFKPIKLSEYSDDSFWAACNPPVVPH